MERWAKDLNRQFKMISKWLIDFINQGHAN